MSAKETKKTVLVVDDDADLRQQMTAALKDRYEVVTAASGKECLQAVARRKPACIVMDVMMDDLTDGLETAQKLKASKETAAIPVILLTAVNKSYDYRSQADPGLFPHDKWLDKPVKAERLLKEVAALAG